MRLLQATERRPTDPPPARHGVAEPAELPIDEDAAILVRMRGGDIMAFGQFYDLWCNVIYACAFHVYGTSHEAESLLDAAMWEIWRKSLAYDVERDNPQHWIRDRIRSCVHARRMAVSPAATANVA
jgi:hypothetical protein